MDAITQRPILDTRHAAPPPRPAPQEEHHASGNPMGDEVTLVVSPALNEANRGEPVSGAPPEVVTEPQPAPPTSPSGPTPWTGSSGNAGAGPTPLGNGTWQMGGALAMLDDRPAVPVPDSQRQPPAEMMQELSKHLKETGSPESAEQFTERMNVRFLTDGSPATTYARELFEGTPVRMATAGYSNPPDGYEPKTRRFMDGLNRHLQGKLGYITSPTLDPIETIDAISTLVAQKYDAPTVYISEDANLKYSTRVPAEIDAREFEAQPKFFMKDQADYSVMTGHLSNSFLITGGRNQAVNEFEHAVNAGHKVVILLTDDVKKPTWDPDKNRVDNASRFLQAFLDPSAEVRQGLQQQIPQSAFYVDKFRRNFDAEGRWVGGHNMHHPL
ncbi:MAG: hypothetical protein AB1758_21385, partial [Candidatus Eremiobacterota bacterium]